MTITLEQLRDGARELADMQDPDDFVSETTWNEWINQGITELHRIECNANPDTYFVALDFTLTTGNTYALPSDFESIRGLDLNPGQSNRQTVHRFTFGNRNGATRAPFDFYSPRERSYRVVSRSLLVIEPAEQAAGNYRLYYVPRPTRLATPKTVSFSAMDTADGPDVPPLGGLAGAGSWHLLNANPDAATDIPPDGGFDLTLTFTTTNLLFSGTYNVVSFGDVPMFGRPTFGCSNLVSVAGFTSPPTGSGTFTYQPVNTAFELDSALEPYAEYIMVVAAIKALAKEESDTRDLIERRNLLREDIIRTGGLDDNEPDGIIDVGC
jgi:hypothetical protein